MDLGTVIEEHAASQSKGKRRGKKERSQGVDIRPKRRAPISQVLLVGGATRMPAFQRFVKNMTGLQPKGFTVDPDEVCSHFSQRILQQPGLNLSRHGKNKMMDGSGEGACFRCVGGCPWSSDSGRNL